MQPPRHGDPVATQTADLAAERRQALRDLFPEAFSEGRLDPARLLAAIGEATGEAAPAPAERYAFTWAGKQQAIQLLQAPCAYTLAPRPDQSVNFDGTQHIFIEGDNLDALKLLKGPYAGRVKMIYIDPPYNTGNDFIYEDNYSSPEDGYLKFTGQRDADGNDLTNKVDRAGRYHSAWLSMMYPRLFLARQLLRDDGFIVISIDDAEISNLQLILNEIFGEENHVAVLVWDRNRKNDAKFFSVGHEYMLVYALNVQYLKENDVVLRTPKEGIEELRAEYSRLRREFGNDDAAVAKGLKAWFAAIPADDPRKSLARFSKVDHRGPYRDDWNMSWPGGGGPTYDVMHPVTGRPCRKPANGWRLPSKERFDEEIAKGNVVFGADETTIPSLKWYIFEKSEEVMKSVHYSYAQTAAQEFDRIFDGKRVFDNPKHYADLARMIEYLSGPDDLILDFFAGSCSTAHAVFNSNVRQSAHRRVIAVQLPEPVNPNTPTGKNALELGLSTVADIGKQRIRRVIQKLNGDGQPQQPLTDATADLGFRVFEQVPSLIRPWAAPADADPAAFLQVSADFIDPLAPGWQPADLIAEVALKEAGFGLNYRVEPVPAVTGQTVHRVTDPDRGQSFYICLDAALALDNLAPLGLDRSDLFICRDAALDDDTAANLALQCRLKTI